MDQWDLNGLGSLQIFVMQMDLAEWESYHFFSSKVLAEVKMMFVQMDALVYFSACFVSLVLYLSIGKKKGKHLA